MTPLAYSLTSAAEAAGLSQSALRRAIADGSLRIKKTKRDEKGNPMGKTVILASDLQAFLEGLPDA